MQKIYVRYPIPHSKGVENSSADFAPRVQREIAEHPELSPIEAAQRVAARLEAEVESMKNFGPHALEKLEPGATMEVVFWEKEIAGEIRELIGHVYMDPQSGQRFSLEIASGPTDVPRSTAPHSGYGIPDTVKTVSRMTLQKVAAR